MRISNLLFYFLIILVSGCIEEYPPPIVDGEVDFLVVDGAINSATGEVEVKITRAVALASMEAPLPELNAQLHIKDTDGNQYQLIEEGDGYYHLSNIPIESTKAYQLTIKRSDGREYSSAFVTAKQTPLIDSVTWAPTRLQDGIQIRVNTHDDTSNTRYYYWSFVETYEYTSPFLSLYKYENEMVVNIPREDYVNRCWQTLSAQSIRIATSELLANDIIRDFVVNEIPVGSQKLAIHYSILVQQRALSKEAYTYWLNLQNTTENLGSLFDPQPGKVNGNIININDTNEPVIGYFDVGEVQEKRLFIKSSDLPENLRTGRDLMGCELDSVSLNNVGNVGKVTGLSLVYGIVEGISLVGYTYSRVVCTDCRLQGGTTTKPLFWE